MLMIWDYHNSLLSGGSMSKMIDIPVVVESGQKYKTSQGVTAIKDGVKSTGLAHERLPKPKWLRIVNHTYPCI